jgi:SAM-dependent methyltransferase
MTMQNNINNSSQYSPNQKQTGETFSFKWSMRNTYESSHVKEKTILWLYEKYCNNNPEVLHKWLNNGNKKILDAGCGSGYSALIFFGEELNKNLYFGVDISDAIYVAKDRFLEAGIRGTFIKSDIMHIPFKNNTFDIIFSEGVLHHTDSTEESIYHLSKKLKSNGLFLFYVYKKKAIIREYTDDLIRNKIKSLSNEQAWEILKPLSKLGISLGNLNVKVNIEEDIELLGIKKGSYDLQRFFYYNICKCFYDPNFSLDEINHINFDWFRPLNCSRHTPEEIIEYCNNANLIINNLFIDDSGITVVAIKK